MKVLITGADGQLGHELQATAPEAVRILACSRARLDVTRAGDVSATLRELGPQVIIHAAAFTAVDRAEEEPELAEAVNADGARNVAQAAAAASARLIHLSTDFVFDGRRGRPYPPGAEPHPLGVYGATKARGERYVREVLGNQALILRTAWVYSRHGVNFVRTMLRLLAERPDLAVVDDQIGSPTWARGLARAIWRAVERPGLRGTQHWTDAGVASWYDFAVAIQEEATAAGLLQSRCVVRAVSSDEYPTAARRPACGVLDKKTTWRALGLTAPHWRRQLRAMLLDLKEHPDA